MIIFTCLLWKKNKHALVNIFPSIGIAGTFIGIIYSLFGIDFNNIQAAVPQLLGGMKIAFITSAAGIISSFSLKTFLEYKEPEVNEGASMDTIATLLSTSNYHLSSLKESINGDDDSTLMTQIQKLRVAVVDKNDELIKEFKEFSENQAENNTNALIEALQEVMRDFNTKINEQFGDNFKQLNNAVGKLLTWQENYYEQIQTISEHISNSKDVLEMNKNIMIEITDKYTDAMQVSSKMEEAINCLDAQRETLANDTEKFSELVDKSKDVFPTIEDNINNLTEKLSTAILESSNQASQIVENQKIQIDQNITSLNSSYEKSLNEMNNLQSKIISDMKGSINEIDKGLKEELNKSLSSLGQQLTALSSKFVNDYKPLTEKLQKIIKISEGVNQIHSEN